MELEKLTKIIEDHERRIKELEKNQISTTKIKKEEISSILNFILELKEDGFFDRPKFLNDVIDELGRKGHHFKTPEIAKFLLYAVQQNKLSRIGKIRKWQYTK